MKRGDPTFFELATLVAFSALCMYIATCGGHFPG